MNGEKLGIFICEDSPLICRGLSSAIEQIDDFQIVGSAADGLTALEGITKVQPHLVLMDVLMPLMDGIELTSRVKEKHPSVKVLMLTAASDEQTIFAALASGADGYCLKQTPITAILQALTAVASGAGWLDPMIAMRVLRNSARDGSVSSQNLPRLGTKDERFRLSPREIEVLHLLVEGLSNKGISERLVVSVETVKSHMRHIMEKLQVADRTQAAIKALRAGLVDKETQTI